MKTADRDLCQSCRQILHDSKMIYKIVPGHEGDAEWCAWCKRKKPTSRYRIQYERRKT